MSDNINIRNCKSEIDKQVNALNERKIVDVFLTNCNLVRGGSCFKCSGKCGSKISDNIPESVQIVKDFRSFLWESRNDNVTEASSRESIRDHRNAKLINELFMMKDSAGKFNFTLGHGSDKLSVCKDFYRKCTGFGRRAFNKICHFVQNYNNPDRVNTSFDKYFDKDGLIWKLCGTSSRHLPKVQRSIINISDVKSKKKEEEVVAFLDRYFQRGDIDLPGDAEGIRYTRLPWTMVYDKYLESCKTLDLEPANYNYFCSIRQVNVITKLYISMFLPLLSL
jgi:hypothetical protein